jgi:hypothetical protein
VGDAPLPLDERVIDPTQDGKRAKPEPRLPGVINGINW